MAHAMTTKSDFVVRESFVSILVYLQIIAIIKSEIAELSFKGGWTMWFNRDKPSGTGDFETLNDIRKKYPGKVCQRPLKIDGKQANGKPINPYHNIVHLIPHHGLVCKIKDQESGYCEDYMVRFYCCS